jgi:polyvinyl alcohol dehydrogenase (cytochrome)
MWFSSVFATRRAGSPRTRPGRRKPAALRPTVEALENRLVPSGVDVISGDPKDWAMFNHDPEGTRSNSAETRLRPDNVSGLHVLWSFPTAGPISGTPAVVNDIVYADDNLGNVYAVSRAGHELWHTHLDVQAPWAIKMSSSPLVTNRHVIVGGLDGQIYGLDVNTGALDWTTKPNPHPFATIFSSPTMVGNYVAVGSSSLEEVAVLFPGYGPPTFRGSVALLDPSDGHVLWQTYTITPAEAAAGAAGAAVWSTPSYDQASKTIYVTTGNNYNALPDMPTGSSMSDSFVALDAADGHIKWVNQRTPNDSWNLLFHESSDHPDVDFGDSPQLYKLGGRTVVAAGQKNGVFHVLDAATGAEAGTPTQFLLGSQLGAFHMDTAEANGINYANGVNWPDPFGGQAPLGASLWAISGDGTRALWHLDMPSPNLSGVAVANGVVYLQSLLDGHLYAVKASDGTLLANVFSGGQSSGPAISRGQVYLGTGDVFFATFDPLGIFGYHPGPGTITALGIDLPGSQSEQAVPFRAEATGSITSATPTGLGLLVTFTTSGNALHLGQYTSTGLVLRTGSTVIGTETFTAANGDQFVKTFTGSFQADGSLRGTYALGGGTGRFAGIYGSGSFVTVFDADGVSFNLVIEGEIVWSPNDKH